MAKKTKTALKEFVKALEKHVEVLENPKSNRAKRERATARLRTAAINYASVLYTRTGSASPFTDIPDPQLDESTVKSLAAEKAALQARQAAKKAAKDAEKAAHDDGQPAAS